MLWKLPLHVSMGWSIPYVLRDIWPLLQQIPDPDYDEFCVNDLPYYRATEQAWL